MKYHLGMPTLLELNNLENNARICSELGLSFVEINMDIPDYSIDRMKPNHIIDISADYGMDFTLHLPHETDLGSFYAPVRHEYLLFVEHTLKWAKASDITRVSMHINNGVCFNMPDKKVFLYDKYFNEFRANLFNSMSKVSHLAAKCGIKLCIENDCDFKNSFIQNVLNEILKSPNISLVWDVGHDALSGYSESDFILAHKDKISQMHLHDCDSTGCHKPLFYGNVDILASINTAKELNIPVVIQVKTVEELKLSVKKLRENNLI